MKPSLAAVPISVLNAESDNVPTAANGFVTAETKSPFTMSELGKLGPNLPVGIMINGKRSRPFRLRPFRLKEEKEIAKLRQDAKAMTIGKFVLQVMSKMLMTIGPHNFDTMKEGERVLALCQLTMADMLYVYLYLRYEALGADEPVGMKLKCPNCSGEYQWYGDLGTIEVQVVGDDVQSLDRDFELRDGVILRGEMRKKLKLGPFLWGTFLSPDFQDKSKQNTAVITASIVGVEGIDQNPFRIGDDELDELTKYDLNAVIDNIDNNTPGPKLRLEPTCPTCNYKTAIMLDWGYESFFSRSARVTRTKT